ncbi:hypothetical protein H4R35_000761 [Dimargaris xerosporica]|nr:hypothetical protein H4R35_000761 [Dimargaris xerosporica]
MAPKRLLDVDHRLRQAEEAVQRQVKALRIAYETSLADHQRLAVERAGVDSFQPTGSDPQVASLISAILPGTPDSEASVHYTMQSLSQAFLTLADQHDRLIQKYFTLKQRVKALHSNEPSVTPPLPSDLPNHLTNEGSSSERASSTTPLSEADECPHSLPTALSTSSPATSYAPSKPIVMGAKGVAGTKAQPTFNEVVRSKDARKKLTGINCHSCQEFYKDCGPLRMDTLDQDSAIDCADDVTEHVALVSRHRYQNVPKEPGAGYWDIDFPESV